MNFAVAIDGPAGAGKSSVAKAAAKELGFVYVDTGALYRAVGIHMVGKGISCDDIDSIVNEFPNIVLEIEYQEDGQHVILCGKDVSQDIRTGEAAKAASDFSKIPQVRSFLLSTQLQMAEKYNVIMDGRDIGTVILPNAQVKVFLTAFAEARAHRRYLEMQAKDASSNYEDILAEIISRDKQDSERETAPLKPAEDSILLDTSDINFEESVKELLRIIRERM